MNWFEWLHVLLFMQTLALIFNAVMLAMLLTVLEKLVSRLSVPPPPTPSVPTRETR